MFKYLLAGLLFLGIVMPITVSAGGFEFSDELTFSETFGYAKNNGSSSKDAGPNVAGGFFVGTLLDYTRNDNKLLGVLGIAAVGATPVGEGLNVAYSLAGCPLTFFNDLFQACYGYNFTDSAGMIYAGTSPLRF